MFSSFHMLRSIVSPLYFGLSGMLHLECASARKLIGKIFRRGSGALSCPHMINNTLMLNSAVNRLVQLPSLLQKVAPWSLSLTLL